MFLTVWSNHNIKSSTSPTYIFWCNIYLVFFLVEVIFELKIKLSEKYKHNFASLYWPTEWLRVFFTYFIPRWLFSIHHIHYFCWFSYVIFLLNFFIFFILSHWRLDDCWIKYNKYFILICHAFLENILCV